MAFVGLLAFAAVQTSHADTAPEQIVGAIEALVFVCRPIDPRSAKVSPVLLENRRVARKLDLPALRQSEA